MGCLLSVGLVGALANGDFRFKLLFLCASHTLLHVFTDLPFALLPILIGEYGLSILIAGVVVSIPRIFSLAFSIPSGLVADRLGQSKLISLSLFLNVIAATIVLLHPTLETIILCFSLTALASTVYHPPALSVTSIISPPGFLTRGLGFHGASGTLGISLGPITLGLVLSGFEWRFVYLVWLVPIFAVAVLALFVSVDEPQHAVQVEKRDRNLATPLRDVLSVTFFSFLLLMLVRSAASGAISTYVTTYLTGSQGLDASLASLVFGFASLIGLAGVIIGGYTGDKLGWRRSLTLIFSGLTIALSCMFVSASTIPAVIFYLLYAFVNIMTMPITDSLVAKIVPQESRGTAYSLQLIPMSIMGIAMPILLGALISLLEIWVIFPTAICLYGVAFILTQTLKT